MNVTTEFIQVLLQGLENDNSELYKTKRFLEAKGQYLEQINSNLTNELNTRQEQIELLKNELEQSKDTLDKHKRVNNRLYSRLSRTKTILDDTAQQLATWQHIHGVNAPLATCSNSAPLPAPTYISDKGLPWLGNTQIVPWPETHDIDYDSRMKEAKLYDEQKAQVIETTGNKGDSK